MEKKSARLERFEVLDGMRGLAALMVMFLHYNIQYHYSFTFNAYLAVDVFFVLSGFVISHAYANKVLSGMGLVEFMACRVGRLFPLVALGVALGFAALLVQSLWQASDMTVADDLIASLLNLAFIPYLNGHFVTAAGQQVQGLIFPGNTPLWSIFFELLASFAFVALVRFSTRKLLLGVVISLALLVVLPLWLGTAGAGRPFNIDAGWNSMNIVVGLPRVVAGFGIGMIAYRFVQTSAWAAHWGNRKLLGNGVGPCLMLLVALAMPWTLKGAYGLVAVTLLAPLVVIWGALAHAPNDKLRQIMEWLGWFSFPIYCLHEPFLTVAHTLAEGQGSWPFWLSPSVVAGLLAVMTAFAAAKMLDRWKVQRRLTEFLCRHLAANSSTARGSGIVRASKGG